MKFAPALALFAALALAAPAHAQCPGGVCRLPAAPAPAVVIAPAPVAPAPVIVYQPAFVEVRTVRYAAPIRGAVCGVGGAMVRGVGRVVTLPFRVVGRVLGCGG